MEIKLFINKAAWQHIPAVNKLLFFNLFSIVYNK
jgi:hypothetical protein